MNDTDKFVVLGRMSAMLAHEIRNPLAGISAVTQVLEGKIDSDDPRRKYVKLIMKEIDRVNKIVHDLLDYTREARPYFIRTEIASIIENALVSHAEKLDEKSIQLEKDYGAEIPQIEVDLEKIQHVFGNIIENAIEAMDVNGRLKITVGINNEARATGDDVEIAFSDDGKGSVLEDLNEMFSPFYTTKTKGTGLGLAVGSKVVEQHNGKLVAAANPDRGLVFTVFLPVKQPLEKTSSKQQK